MKTSARLFAPLVLVLLSAGWCLSQAPPAVPPGVQAGPESAAYWIARDPAPDRVILPPAAIEAMNRAALSNPETELVDLFSIADLMEGSVVRRVITDVLTESRKTQGYDHTNRRIAAAFYRQIESDIGTIPDAIRPSWGLITSRASLRRLPTNEAFYDRPFGNEFDRFQYSTLECGSAVVILHRTVDKSWAFVQTSYTLGWVPSAGIASGDRRVIESFVRSHPLVATGSMIPVYTDPGFTTHAASIPMGSKLPFMEKTERHYAVILPWRTPEGGLQLVPAYIRPDADVSVGFLPYTARNVYLQVFKLDGQPYGWGDLFDGRDCSRLVMDVFSTFGFDMPRNTRRQAAFNPAGRKDAAELSEKDKIRFLQSLGGRPALLYMPGHIMIYLGSIDGRAYAIHSAWSWRETQGAAGRTVTAGRVVVSDITRGTGSRGSLLKRVIAIIPLG